MARYDICGRTVLITGAARGIGAAAAARLYAAGANVALVGLEPDLLHANAAALGERAAAFEADVSDMAALEQAVAATVQRFGGIDVAIANAGISYLGALASAPVEQIERTFEVNLLGVWRTNRAVLPHVMARQGYVLNISSLSAISHAPLMGAYTASKAGVEAFSDALRMEVAPSGTRVGCAYFGFIDTDLVRQSFAHNSVQGMLGMLPGFVRTPLALDEAIDAIEQGVQRRSARIWAPRWIGPALVLRGVLQPLTELKVLHSKRLGRAIDVADASVDDFERLDPKLGVAAAARAKSPAA